jgi:hypothetical protein
MSGEVRKGLRVNLNWVLLHIAFSRQGSRQDRILDMCLDICSRALWSAREKCYR